MAKENEQTAYTKRNANGPYTYEMMVKFIHNKTSRCPPWHGADLLILRRAGALLGTGQTSSSSDEQVPSLARGRPPHPKTSRCPPWHGADLLILRRAGALLGTGQTAVFLRLPSGQRGFVVPWRGAHRHRSRLSRWPRTGYTRLAPGTTHSAAPLKLPGPPSDAVLRVSPRRGGGRADDDAKTDSNRHEGRGRSRGSGRRAGLGAGGGRSARVRRGASQPRTTAPRCQGSGDRRRPEDGRELPGARPVRRGLRRDQSGVSPDRGQGGEERSRCPESPGSERSPDGHRRCDGRLSRGDLESSPDGRAGAFRLARFLGGRPPWPRASGSEPERRGQTASSERQDTPSESPELNNNEEKFSRRWIDHLVGRETNLRQYQPDSELQKETTQGSGKERNALQSFCNDKINLIRGRGNSKEGRRSRGKKVQLRPDAGDPEMEAQKRAVPDELVNRICLKNLRATLKQVSAAKQHISSQCHHCNRKRAELAQSAFLKQKTTLLESLLLQQKIDEHLHTTDFLTFIGEAHKSLPRLSDDPRLIWKRLTEKSQIGCSGCEKSDTEQKL
ncbi:uncharacterized protein C8orf48 homolog [Elephas maximus indicus]|uniref:uncharacterized protein C8orf48 homolog n=1 Tax=Elephas maximus indicus TaxID=99487 RepID=UPI0021166D33|nr:uncharacterized protein C8orf48 homolog [Elephas maximus indicus]